MSKKDYDYIDWYCDNCNAHMNYQSGFTTITGGWTCTECGYRNDVTDNNVLWDDAENNEERLSVWEAADIWRSHGKDEDYMFGYTEEELENA